MKITAIRLDRIRLPLDPPFRAAGDTAGHRMLRERTGIRIDESAVRRWAVS